MQSIAIDQAEIARREEERDPCEIEASLYFLPKVRIPCLIKDLSPKGAKLKVDAGIKLPKHIFLLMPVVDDFTETRHCELRWRIEGVVGLKFVVPNQEMIDRFKADVLPPSFTEDDVAAFRTRDTEAESLEYQRLRADTHFRDLLTNRGNSRHVSQPS